MYGGAPRHDSRSTAQDNHHHQPPSLLYQSDATRYMRHHKIPLLVESILSQVVPTSHPFPMEAVGQALLVTAPSAEDVARQVDAVMGWATCRDEEVVTVLGGAQIMAPDAERAKTVGQEKQRSWTKQLSTLSFNVFALGEDGVNDGPEVIALVWWMFEACGCLAAMRIDTNVFLRWVVMVRANYHRCNPFHNFRHAFNVLQTLFVFLQQATELHLVDDDNRLQGGDGLEAAATTVPPLVFTEVEIFSMLVSALCHDVQHVGVNNAFLVDTQHPLAIRHNDNAVLERHHASVTFAILEYAPLPRIRTAPACLAGGYIHQPPVLGASPSPSDVANNYCDVAASLPRRWGPIAMPQRSCKQDRLGGDLATTTTTLGGCWSDPNQDYATFRQLVLQCILGTEVAAHKTHLALLKELVIDEVQREAAASEQPSSEGPPTAAVPPPLHGARKKALQHLLIKNTAARHALMVALVEAADVSNEIRSFDFSRRWAPLVVEEFCRQGDAMTALGWTREIPGMFRRGVAHPSKDQPGFIHFLCLPLYRQLASVMPTFFDGCVKALEQNAAMWTTKW